MVVVVVMGCTILVPSIVVIAIILIVIDLIKGTVRMVTDTKGILL